MYYYILNNLMFSDNLYSVQKKLFNRVESIIDYLLICSFQVNSINENSKYSKTVYSTITE